MWMHKDNLGGGHKETTCDKIPLQHFTNEPKLKQSSKKDSDKG